MTARVNEYGQVVDGHLGGYVPGGDPNTFVPGVWEWLIEEYEVKTVLDVGCGDGKGALAWFAEHLPKNGPYYVLGIDGLDPPDADHPPMYIHDFTTGPPWDPDAAPRFDMCWSAEFVEHVEDRYVPNIVAAFQTCEVVVMTHAVPGQGGYHHVNCRTDDYWLGVMDAAGYQWDDTATRMVRGLAAQPVEGIPPEANYVARSGLVFVKR